MGMKASKEQKSKGGRRIKKVFLGIGISLAVLVVAGFFTFVIARAMGKSNLKKQADSDGPILDTGENESDKEEAGLVTRNGKKYRYNEDIITILCMGIDTKEAITNEDGNRNGGGQADANFLLVLDNKNKKISVIGIPRDTMTDIDIYDVFGQYSSTSKEHLALQYAYGDGGTLSCELMQKAVSNLMYQLPIHGYVSINLDAIATLNDMVGGVTVEITDEYAAMKYISRKAGETVTLWGDEAVLYVQARDVDKDFSAYMRLARQKQYLMAFMNKAMSAVKADLPLALEMYKSVSEHMVTNLGASEIAYLAPEAVGCAFDSDSFYILEGENRRGAVYDEYHVDDEALYDLILEVFYLPAED